MVYIVVVVTNSDVQIVWVLCTSAKHYSIGMPGNSSSKITHIIELN